MKKLGELLLEQGKLSERDIERTLLAQQEMGGMFGQVLVRLGLVSETDVALALSSQLEIPLLTADAYPEPLEGPLPVAESFLLSHCVLPLALEESEARFVAATPQDPYLNKALNMALARPVVLCLGLESEINQRLQDVVFGAQDAESEDEEVDDLYAGQSDDEFIEHLRDLASEAPVIRLVNEIIHRALENNASDIHLEPFDNGLHLRYRVDGVLQLYPEPPALSLAPALSSRIKLLSGMNIAETRLPQDGRIMTRVKGHELDLRVSTIPTVHGESIVMRVLDRDSVRLSLPTMGFGPDTLQRYEELLSRPHGVLLVTGPTGSGKTTTLYASLASLSAGSQKIVTVEDPVEYQLPGINQIQVHPQIELSFARSLRAILRQDPDIIMIGEMRDTETAQIGIQSALTGHLVLSTLHTNTAASAITRLEDMGIERYLITSALNGVLAQRLVRTLCEHCRAPVQMSAAELAAAALAEHFPGGTGTVYEAVGCDACQHTGYSGRTGIHELLLLDDVMHREIMSGADARALHIAARLGGMQTLYEDGLRKVAQGMTSIGEVLRVTQDQNEAEQDVGAEPALAQAPGPSA